MANGGVVLKINLGPVGGGVDPTLRSPKLSQRHDKQSISNNKSSK